MAQPLRFLSLEDEIILRRALRMTYKHEGMEGLFKCIGELNDSILIIAQLAKEILEEEKANGL